MVPPAPPPGHMTSIDQVSANTEASALPATLPGWLAAAITWLIAHLGRWLPALVAVLGLAVLALGVVLALVTQWTRQDQREAVHADQQMDAGVDDSFEAYNSMLASFAEREDPTPPHLPHAHRPATSAPTPRTEAGER